MTDIMKKIILAAGLVFVSGQARADVEIPDYLWYVFTSANGEFTVHANLFSAYITGPYGTEVFYQWSERMEINNFGQLVWSVSGGPGEDSAGYDLYYDASGNPDGLYRSGSFTQGCDEAHYVECLTNVTWAFGLSIEDSGLASIMYPHGDTLFFQLPDMREVSVGDEERVVADVPEPAAWMLLLTALGIVAACRRIT